MAGLFRFLLAAKVVVFHFVPSRIVGHRGPFPVICVPDNDSSTLANLLIVPIIRRWPEMRLEAVLLSRPEKVRKAA